MNPDSKKLSGIQSVESLSNKVVFGGVWLFVFKVISRSLGLLKLIIVARMLTATDFGLFALSMLSLSMIETFSQTGFNTALVQKSGRVEAYLDTAWTAQLIRGVLLFLLLFLGAPYLAGFFHEKSATSLIQVIAFALLVRGFRNIAILILQKEMQFKKLFVFEFSGAFIQFGVTVAAAFILRNAWALVWGIIAGESALLVVSYWIYPHSPRIVFNKERLMELFRFGRWVTGSSILLFLITQGDDIFVGKVIGVAALGFYQMAFNLSSLPATELTTVISQVTFPAYSKLKENVNRLKNAYVDVLLVVSFATLPLVGVIFIYSKEFTSMILGDKWLPMVPAMRILCVFGAIRSLAALNGPVFHATGNPKSLTVSVSIKLVLMVVLIYPLSMKFGIAGTALATTLPAFASQFYGFYTIIKIIQCRIRDLLFPIILTFTGTLLIYLPYSMNRPSSASDVLIIVVNLASGLAMYFLFMLIIGRSYKRYSAVNIILDKIAAIRTRG